MNYFISFIFFYFQRSSQDIIIIIIHSMDKFNKTLTILNNLIAKLQANTGGQVPKNKVPAQCAQPQKKFEVAAVQDKNQNVQKKTEKAEKKAEKAEKAQKTEKAQKVEKAEKKQQKKQEGQQTKKEKKNEKAEKKGEKKQQKKEEKKEGQDQKKEDGDATVEDFANIDIRIGEIVECWKHPESEKLYCQKINVCGQVREIASGLQQFVPIGQMKGPVIVMANLKPRPLAKFMSNGMVVCASNADHTDVRIIKPEGAISERVYLEGHEDLFKTAALLPVLNPKKKILQRCLEHFKTDEQGFITWKGIKARTSGGYLKSELLNGSVS